MKIGEFAKFCNTKITVLRHYDKQNLLVPEFTDIFTGYRYYSPMQKVTFERITALKKAGFSLSDIKKIISFSADEIEIKNMFRKKSDELNEAIKNLKEAENIMAELNVFFENNYAKIKASKNDDKYDLCCQLDSYIKNADCQRISPFSVGESEISCRILKLGDEEIINDPILPFEDDPEVIGKWEIVGNYAVREDFDNNVFCNMTFYGNDIKYLWFLPEGEKYWCYSWTKNYLIIDGYMINPIYNKYELVYKPDGVYMVVSLREFESTRGGQPTILALRKVDGERYTPEMIARKDDTDKPFVTDEKIIGKWRAYAFLGKKSEFPADEESPDDLYFKEIEFFPDGECRCVYEDAVFEGKEQICWTKNYLLRKWNWSACEYEVRIHNGIEYMIIEWKSGDYRFGGFDTNYYVFVRA